MTDTNAKIDAAGAFALLERVVAERGEDHIYRAPNNGAACLYLHDGVVPGCGVGLAVSYAGVALDTLAKWDAEVRPLIQYVGREFFDENGLAVLASFQEAQDNREPYRVALACARGVFDRQQAA